MSKTINNLVNHIEIVHGTNEKETIPKLGLRTIIQGNRIILISPAGGSGTTSVRQSVSFLYTDVTNPSEASAEALRDVILGWCATGKAGEDLVGIAPSYIGKNNGTNADFTVAWTSGTEMTLSAFTPDITQIYESDIEVIRHCSAAGVLIAEYTHTNSTINDNGSSVITVTEAAFGATDLFVIFTNIPKPSGGGGASADADYKIGSWDGTVVWASSTTLTLAGSYPTINYNSQVVFIKFTDDTLHTAEVFVNGQNGVVIEHSAGTLTIIGVGTPFTDTNDYEVGINATPVGMDISGDALKTLVQNMEAGHYTDPEHVDEDNEGARNDTKYTRTAIEMGSYKYLSFTYLITSDDVHNDVRLKVYATNKNNYSLPDEDTAIADSDMIFDVSEEVLGNAAGISVNNGSSGDNECIDTPTKYYAFVFELKYDEDDTSTPLNAVDIYIIRY